MSAMATLKDVATRAGVSIATVSRVINEPEKVKLETRMRVERVIRQLNFTPSRVARRLRARRKTGELLAVLIPDIQNPFYVDVVRGIDEVAAERGFGFMMSSFSHDPKRASQYIRLILSESIDGLIVGPPPQHQKLLVRIWRSGVPMVCIDRPLEGAEVDTVVVDNREGARSAVQYLTSLGHRRIGLICGPVEIPTYRDRRLGYLDALREAGIEADPELIRVGDSTRYSGHDLAEELLSLPDPPTALFTTNNLITLGALEVLHARGIRIPEQVSIVGFDDMYWSNSLNPPLTAVSQPGYEIGRRAAELIVERIAHPDRMPVRLVLKTELKIRASCGPAPGSCRENGTVVELRPSGPSRRRRPNVGSRAVEAELK